MTSNLQELTVVNKTFATNRMLHGVIKVHATNRMLHGVIKVHVICSVLPLIPSSDYSRLQGLPNP